MMRKDAALLVALVAALLILPSAARAGTYDVVSCNTPLGEGGGINRAWTIETYNRAGKAAPPASSFSSPASVEKCDTPAGLLLNSLSGPATVRVDDGAGFTFRAPAGTTVRDISVWRYTAARMTSATAGSPYWVSVARAGTAAGGSLILGGSPGKDYCAGNAPTTPYPAYCVTGTAGYTAASIPATYASIGQPVITWGIECAAATPTAQCATASAATATPSNEAHAGVQFQGAKVTVEDLVPPEIGATGNLDGWRRPSEPQGATATDVAGIRSVRVLVDGTERAARTLTCDYHLPAPCPVAAGQPYDLAGVADGHHKLTTIAEDSAGNVTRSDRTVDVDGSPPALDLVPLTGRTIRATVSDALSGVQGGTIEIRAKRDAPFTALRTTLRNGRLSAPVPSRLKPDAVGIRISAIDKAGNRVTSIATSMSLSTRVGDRARKVQNARATIPYGHAVRVLGRLTTTDGSPIANQSIVVTGVLRQTGAAPQAVATASTDTGGRFAVLVPAGPSRTVSVEYTGAPGLLHRVRSVALRVPADSTIHAATDVISGAGSIRFSGRLRLLGTELPPGGKIVDLQASQGGRWSTVATTRANGPTAAWHARARFRGTPGRFPIRLRIRREAVFPYELGYSPSVVIRVR
jgi:hypothetical protein